MPAILRNGKWQLVERRRATFGEAACSGGWELAGGTAAECHTRSGRDMDGKKPCAVRARKSIQLSAYPSKLRLNPGRQIQQLFVLFDGSPHFSGFERGANSQAFFRELPVLIYASPLRSHSSAAKTTEESKTCR